ncbi:MAG: EAL domain-containing protein [Desulfobulbaceae bacterium]|jgi:predicted signal transduction protein with EAL and GGDEF domain/DNA-binding response OmpR family regulator|nr:EAL domain-containing protein [Desulfobulbaceae bacterium]
MTEQEQARTPEAKNAARILVVDDDASVRMQVCFTLENAGYAVYEAEDGAGALALFQEHLPELVMLDVVLPDTDGMEICAAIRALPGGLHTPLVMITGLEDIDTINRAFDAGATDFISKPINLLILSYRAKYWLRSGQLVGELHEVQRRLFSAQKIARLGHWDKNLDTGLFRLTCTEPRMLGLTPDCDYEALFAAIDADKRDEARRQIEDACAADRPFSTHYPVRLATGDTRIVLNQGEVIYEESRRQRLAVGIIQDITELKQAEDRIRYLAFYDNLTGLANRSLFREHWNKVRPLASRNGRMVAVFFVDLDHFKRINDSLGHPAGDRALVAVAERMKLIFRHSDVIARAGDEFAPPSLISRVGGDEFTILATDMVSTEHIAHLAERINGLMCEPVRIENQLVTLTASVGISVYPSDGDDIDTLLKNADTAMYEAKRRGRNNYQFYQHAMNEEARLRFHLSNRLRQAIENHELILHYQPQFSTVDGRLSGCEALVRWQDPERGLVPPSEFLPFAEESGLIHLINELVLEDACKQAAKLVKAGMFAGCRMAVNISGNNIDFSILRRNILRLLTETGLAPEYLEIELTERVMMENVNEAREILQDLKDRGISVAIDDFGTGYSALSHLQVFPLTTLKIDKSFVQNMDASTNGRELLQAIIYIAKCFDLKVIAEGVETARQMSELEQMQCDELQGFYLSRPITVAALEERLQMTSASV